MKKFLLSLICLTIYPFLSLQAQTSELRRAKSLIDAGEYLEAAKILRPLADGGNAEAQYLAAGLFVEGKGVVQSEEQAEKYYKMSAAQMYQPALLDLANYYIKKENQDKAFNLLNEAVKSDKALCKSDAGFLLGQMYFNGNGTVEDVEKGMSLMIQSYKYTSNKSRDERYLNDHRFSFYTKLITKYLHDEDSLIKKLTKDFGQIMPDNTWTDAALKIYFMKIKNLDYGEMSQHFIAWKVADECLMKQCVLAIMYYNGLGTNKNIEAAQNYSNKIKQYSYQTMSYVNQFLNDLSNSIKKNADRDPDMFETFRPLQELSE